MTTTPITRMTPLRAAAAALTAMALGVPAVHAADALPPSSDTSATASEGVQPPLPNERIGSRVLNPEPPVPANGDRPLSGLGRWLTERGITPRLSGTYMYYGNPSTGLDTGKSESVGIVSAGAQFDLGKIVGLKGGTLHFEQLFAHVNNLNYGNEVGGVLAGKPGPYIPRTSHLTLLTYEQKLLDDKLALEVGKSNAGNYFALPLCNVPVTCGNTILMDTAGFNPPPYANWSARASYDFTPALRMQAGAWRSDAAYPFTDGWERRGNAVGGSAALSSLYVANVVYRTDEHMERYPRTYEALAYYNNGTQTNPYYTTAGTSRLSDPASPARTSDGTGGFYLGAKQTFWRADDGTTSLAAWGNLTRAFNPDTTAGIGTMGRAGLTLTGPWRSRPFDSYGLSFGWAQLTQSKQRQIADSHLAASGQPYGVGRNEYSLGLDTVFVLDRGVIIAPYATRIWNANSYMNPSTGRTPRDGWTVGLLMHIQIDDYLGFNGR